jgi:tRNA A37 threonylcarbamoyladenosine modification protein TsaB
VNTLEAIAGETAKTLNAFKTPIWCVLNAQRQQLFAAMFCSQQSSHLETLQPEIIYERAEWVAQIQKNELVTGPGLMPIREMVEAKMAELGGGTVAPEHCWSCRAESVGRLAIQKAEKGQTDDYWKLKPDYFRPSAAEEVWLAKNKGP